MSEKKVKLYMCCHSKVEALPPLFTPIQCGAAINPPLNNAVPDNTGENISAKNREYCELTAHYYTWKNERADFYGFCHYRRFFGFNITAKRPYAVYGKLSNSSKLFLYDKDRLDGILSEYCIIAPYPENMGISAKEYYCTSKFHYAEDLELFIKILNDKYPHMSRYASEYLSQNKQYFCNMFIMDKRHFFEYCEMLFGVLNDFDIRKTLHGDFQSDRTDGYLGEIFTGIYFTYVKQNSEKIKELLRIDVNCSFKKRILYKLLPPQTKLRFAARRAERFIRRMLSKNK